MSHRTTIETIEAERWTRPPPDEVRRLVEATGLSQVDVGRCLGVGERRVRHWLAARVDRESRRISYVEWVALKALIVDRRRDWVW